MADPIWRSRFIKIIKGLLDRHIESAIFNFLNLMIRQRVKCLCKHLEPFYLHKELQILQGCVIDHHDSAVKITT